MLAMAFTLRLSPELEKRMKVFADEWGVSLQSLATVAITDYLLLRDRRGSWIDFVRAGYPRPRKKGRSGLSERDLPSSEAPADRVGLPEGRKLTRQQRRALERAQKKGRGE